MAKTTETRPETLEWLLATGRGGERRIRTFSWRRLARIYRREKAGSPIRKAIANEARRGGYTLSTIIALNG